MNQPYGPRPAYPIAFFLFALAMPFAVAAASGDRGAEDPRPGQETSGKVASGAKPAAVVPVSLPAQDAAPQRLSIPPRALRLKNPPPGALKHLTYSAREGFALRMVSNQDVTAGIRNGAGRTLAFTARTLEAGDWTLRPRNLAPGFYTVLLRTGPNLRALHLKIGDAERGQGPPEWVVEKASDSTHAPAPSTPGKMSDLAARDLRHVWHPCSQMRDYADFPPLEVVGAHGSRLHLADGRTLIDAISSWWCKSLGHGHPRLREALARQAGRFEHVILANTTNDVVVRLSERLGSLAPGLTRVFYGGDGSTAVEIAAKLALHARRITGSDGSGGSRGSRGSRSSFFMALENGYHGETALTLGLSDLGLYRDAYADVLPPVDFLRGLPYVDSDAHPLWNDCSSHWPALERQLEEKREGLCAVVVEPILQGAGGMRFYSADFLRRLRAWTRARGVYLIADEILTGFGRTGSMLACEHAGIVPDLVCLSKGLTAGWMPMSAVLVSEDIYDLFYAEYGTGRDFLHSNTYAGNPLGAAVALEALDIYREEDICGRVRRGQGELRAAMDRVAAATGRLTNVRCLGGVAAAELTGPGVGPGKRAGYRVYREAVARGALLRTLGDTVYWLLPLNAENGILPELEAITLAAIRAALD